ncbi:uncharacterized protein PHALS_00997 [Plasmopara halstedii]|uniref:Uncharacterized protein n=1 Tax=Plasmopara halstedii TaxID=4781 RepID=A0A0N7L6M0_PLAHL|nr:uncharacterized protein PHALS_00997 [Plasmopara halstedii]CEG44651.1 hypothetical protein PHALS_00997 [Plasmopara halstedii]|eukprot:XP_024581020.1 hypothetical protein PHALS_00997 [Plasmopara halstedii]
MDLDLELNRSRIRPELIPSSVSDPTVVIADWFPYAKNPLITPEQLISPLVDRLLSEREVGIDVKKLDRS